MQHIHYRSPSYEANYFAFLYLVGSSFLMSGLFVVALAPGGVELAHAQATCLPAPL
jgi:hypothetical protein